MSVESLINLAAVVASSVTLYFLLRRPIDRLETRLDNRISRLEARFDEQEVKLDARFDAQESSFNARFDRLDAKIDGVHHELVELRLETRETLARHDERLTALEAQRPKLVLRG